MLEKLEKDIRSVFLLLLWPYHANPGHIGNPHFTIQAFVSVFLLVKAVNLVLQGVVFLSAEHQADIVLL